jgi:hypothetical protein
MNTSKISPDIAQFIKSFLNNATEDIFGLNRFTLSKFQLLNNLLLILATPNEGNAPANYYNETCFFCGLNRSNQAKVKQLNHRSTIYFEDAKQRALHFPHRCTETLSANFLADMVNLAFALKSSPILTVINLPGSGASTPEHVHSKLIPLQYCKHNQVWENTIVSLLNSIKVSDTEVKFGLGLSLQEIILPVWGVKINYNERLFSPDQIAQKTFQIISAFDAYSRINIGYNIFINSLLSNEIILTIREKDKEQPFSTDQIFRLIEKTAGLEKAQQIRNSFNSEWRWGWLECLGGIIAKDNAFSNHEIFDSHFWLGVYDFLQFPKKYRSEIIATICEMSLTS